MDHGASCSCSQKERAENLGGSALSASNTTGLLQQANYILDACGRPQSPPNVSWVDIPAHVGYSRFMAPNSVGTEDLTGIRHKGRVSFMIRAITAQILPRVGQGIYWRIKCRIRSISNRSLHLTGQATGSGLTAFVLSCD